MPPATSSAVRLRRRDEGAEIPRAAPNDPRAFWRDAFRDARAETQRRAAPLTAQHQLHHEQQHQELLLTDVLHAFAQNPLAPAYAADWRPPAAPRSSEFVPLPAGIHRIGFEGAGYSFDNEGPPHAVLLQPASIGRALVTNRQWLDFMADGGYATPSLWLSDGGATVDADSWDPPRSWNKRERAWHPFTLGR